MVWRANEQRVWSGLPWTYQQPYLQLHNNQPFADIGKPSASQCLSHLDYIQVGERHQERSWCGIWVLSSE